MKRAATHKQKDPYYIDSGSISDEDPEQPFVSKKQKYESKLIIPPNVSAWRQRKHLDVLGLFYAENPVESLEILLDKSLSYDAISHIHQLNPLLKPLVKLVEEWVNFNANEFDPNSEDDTWTSDMESINKCHDNILKAPFDEVMSNFIKAIPQKVMEIRENRSTLERMLLNVWSGVLGFYNTLKYFMVDTYRKKRKKEGCCEMVYTELYRDFFKTCGLIFRSGEDTKNIMKFGKFQSSSKPELRCRFENVIVRQLLGEVVLIIGNVKKTKVNNMKLTSQNLIDLLESYDILGQHGGELLLEINDTTFKRSASSPSRLVYGAMIVGTQIVFSALEMDEEHLEAITSLDGDINEAKHVGDSKIFYTKPYDILKASERSELYVSLFRLACYQHHLKIITDVIGR